MIHYCVEHECVQDPSETIPANEPVVMIRATDKFAEEVTRFYAELLLKDCTAPGECETEWQQGAQLLAQASRINEYNDEQRAHWRRIEEGCLIEIAQSIQEINDTLSLDVTADTNLTKDLEFGEEETDLLRNKLNLKFGIELIEHDVRRYDPLSTIMLNITRLRKFN